MDVSDTRLGELFLKHPKVGNAELGLQTPPTIRKSMEFGFTTPPTIRISLKHVMDRENLRKDYIQLIAVRGILEQQLQLVFTEFRERT